MVSPLLLAAFVAAPADWKATVAPLAAAATAEHANAALVVGVFDGTASHVYGFGSVDLRTGKQTPNGRTIFAIGSITKAFTGLLLADSVRRKEVTLTADVNDVLPKELRLARRDDKPVCLEDLATHTSGLGVQPLAVFAARDGANPYADLTRERLAAELAIIKPSYAPGTKPHYSNLGAGLTGVALVHAAKAADYDRLLKSRICDPLGLPDTAEALTGEQLARLAPGFNDDGKPGPHWDFAALSACGGLKSTADDLLKLGAAVAGAAKTPLDVTIADAIRPRRAAETPNTRAGLFWMVSQKEGEPAAVWHNGGTGVIRAVLWVVPERKRAVVVLANHAGVKVEPIAIQLANRP
jgi:serine-type D-Ala-D-Ala carboxypeptidase/endopeptidase